MTQEIPRAVNFIMENPLERVGSLGISNCFVEFIGAVHGISDTGFYGQICHNKTLGYAKDIVNKNSNQIDNVIKGLSSAITFSNGILLFHKTYTGMTAALFLRDSSFLKVQKEYFLFSMIHEYVARFLQLDLSYMTVTVQAYTGKNEPFTNYKKMPVMPDKQLIHHTGYMRSVIYSMESHNRWCSFYDSLYSDYWEDMARSVYYTYLFCHGRQKEVRAIQRKIQHKLKI